MSFCLFGASEWWILRRVGVFDKGGERGEEGFDGFYAEDCVGG